MHVHRKGLSEDDAMRTVIIAAVTAVAVVALYAAFLAPQPTEPAPVEVDADLVRRLGKLERSLAAQPAAEEPARRVGEANVAEMFLPALEALQSRLDAVEARLTAFDVAARKTSADSDFPDSMPATPATSAEEEAREKEVSRWSERLGDTNENTRFSAALELGRLKDVRAAPALIKVLAEDRDYYVRLGAAAALGQMKACAAVPALIEALDDKDTLVRTAANDALQAVTGHTRAFATEMSEDERRAVMTEWNDWWSSNERVVRERLDQPGS